MPLPCERSSEDFGNLEVEFPTSDDDDRPLGCRIDGVGGQRAHLQRDEYRPQYSIL
jgi:hypothetical protein